MNTVKVESLRLLPLKQYFEMPSLPSGDLIAEQQDISETLCSNFILPEPGLIKALRAFNLLPAGFATIILSGTILLSAKLRKHMRNVQPIWHYFVHHNFQAARQHCFAIVLTTVWLLQSWNACTGLERCL